MTDAQSHIVIIGAGNIGRAVEKVLSAKGVTVSFWDADASKHPSIRPLAETIPSASFVFLCVPSQAVRGALSSVVPFLRPETIVVSLSKGIEQESGKFMDEVLTDELKSIPYVLLFGPMLAGELSGGLFGAAVAASASVTARDAVVELWSGSALSVEVSDDVRGVALSGVLKNIYAVGLGMLTYLQSGHNTKGWYVSRAVAELALLISSLGGKGATAYGVSGLADLVATGFSEDSRNVQAGADLARDRICRAESEGCVSIVPLMRRLGSESVKYPLLTLLASVITDGNDPKIAFERYFHAHS